LPTVVVVHPTTPDAIDQCFLSLSGVMIAIRIGIGYFFPDSQMVYRGGWMYNDDRWQGFIDCDFDVTIDLGKETDIKQVCAEFIQLKGPYVWLPKQVIISSSVDG